MILTHEHADVNLDDLAGHPVIDDAAIADEAAFWAAEIARQEAADELVRLDLDRWADEQAEEAAWMDAYEQGLSFA